MVTKFMNKSAALFISVILLTQIASYSFNEVQTQNDWEEPLQGNSNWEVSGRNGSSTQVWSTPVSLDNSTDNVGWESSLAIDSNDNLHVTYLDSTNGNLEYMTYDGSSWSTPVSIDSTDYVGQYSSLAIDSNDNLHVTYLDNTNGNLEYMTYDGSSWSTPVSLDSTDMVGEDSSLAIDSNDNLHVTYRDFTNGNLEYMTYDGSSWSTPVSLHTGGISGDVGRESSLAIDSNDNLHVTYLNNTNGHLEYMTYDGSSWSTPVSLDSTDNVGWESSLAIDSNDNLHVTYLDYTSYNLEYMTYDGSSWSTPVSIDSTDYVGRESSLAIDSNDNLHVTYRDFTNGNLEYMTYNGSSWSTPVSIDSTDNVGWESSLAIDSNDNLHVTYRDYTNGNLEYMTAGNNTGGNNTGGNNTGGNNNTTNNSSNECLMLTNVSNDYNYSASPQDSFNITADLFNYCTDEIMYPSTLILNDTQGINVSSDDLNWRYLIGGNSSYPVSWEVTRDSTVVEGNYVTFEIHPTRDNCSVNCTENQNYNLNLTIPFGLFDLNTCYILDNISDDYVPGESSFNLTASLNNTCFDSIHYPVGILYGGDGTISSPGEGIPSTGQMAYVIFGKNSTETVWQISVDQNLDDLTLVNYSLQPGCAMYSLTATFFQDCSNSTLDMVDYSVMIEMSSNQTVNETDNNTGGNNTDGNNTVDNNTDGNNTVDNNTGGNNTVDNNTGGNNTVDNNTDGNNTVANNTDGNNTDGNNTVDNNTDIIDNFENDTDMDGFDDIVDNCPNVFSFNQDDIDNDGIGDVCDLVTDMDECVFSDIDLEENTEVIFYLNWIDSNGIQHCGTLQFELYSDAAPIHSQNFRDHAAAGNYDGVIFHRIIDTFMIQGGDIQNGDGTGGYTYSWHGYCSGQQISQDDCPSENYYSMPDEFSPDHLHQYGALSMAHSGPNTGGSQFFIMDSESATWLDGVHSVFGQAIAGTIDGQSVAADSVINAISQVNTTGSIPTYDVTIISADSIVILDEVDDEVDDEDDGALPGFTSLISISALLGAAFVRIRKD
jgi:cyclophilin family peptidyl-prolyl cis-trans isomerase